MMPYLSRLKQRVAARRAKILCTIGPKSASPRILEGLLQSGMNMVRLNMSHGTQEWHLATLKTIRLLEQRHETPIPVVLDLQGPRIRIGHLPRTGISLRTGDAVLVTPAHSGDSKPSSRFGKNTCMIPIGFPTLARDVKKGNRILINDGLIEFLVTGTKKNGLECSVTVGGKLTSHKGVNFPDTCLSGPTLTEKDLRDLRFAIENQVEFVALSFVRSAKDIRAIKNVFQKHKQDIPVIAKIERPEAIEGLSEILGIADGVMLARGDLAIEMSLEAVPILQKQVIAEANRRHRLVITATQMLESMTRSPLPTRAETSDVANAVLDGSDALMLSAETSTGQHPIRTVKVMDRIIRFAEQAKVLRWNPEKTNQDLNGAISASACIAAEAAARLAKAKAIVVFTESGATALHMSKQRPSVPIIAFTSSVGGLKRMSAYWGVRAYAMPPISNTDERIRKAESLIKQHGLLKSGHRMVILSGEHAQKATGTNLIKIHLVQ